MSLRTRVRGFVRLVAAAFVAASSAAVAVPVATLGFSPSAIFQGDPVQLTLNIADSTGGALRLINLAAGAFTYPPGITNTGVVALNTCGGVVSAPAGGNTFSLTAGALAASCDIVIDVATAAVGTYTATIPAGAVTTSTGATVASSTATLVVSQAPLSLKPTSLTFGPQDVGTVSPPQTITVTNGGRAQIVLTSISASGDFNAVSGCPGVLAGGASCNIDVTFVPTATGARTGTLQIVTPASTFGASLVGTGTVPPVPGISLTPAALSFSGRTLGTTSAPQVVTVGNPGTAPLSIASIATTGDYSFASACPAVLAVGASCTIDVRFTPLVVGTRDGTLIVASDAPGSPHSVTLTGTGVTAGLGSLDVNPRALDFPAQPVGAQSPAQFVTVSNVGSETVFIINLVVTGDFAFFDPPVGTPACGGPLAPGASCLLGVAFRPVADGFRAGTLRIATDGSSTAIEVGLTGFGVGGATQRALDLPASLAFGAQPVGTRSAGRSLEILNTTGQPVILSEIAAAGDFSVGDGCRSIDAGARCTLTVFFLPTVRGARAGTLTLRLASEVEPYVVALSGEGTVNPQALLSVTPARIGFGNVFASNVTRPSSIVLANVGELPVALDGFMAPGDFLLDSHCGATLAAGEHCTLDVRFYPRLLGERGGALTVLSNASGSPHVVDLSGRGCALPNMGRNRVVPLLCGP
jgi:hypothetical protein